MRTIVYLTSMLHIPQNCMECKLELCNLPTLRGDPTKVSKKYLVKRHPKCPLRTVHTEDLERGKGHGSGSS